MSMWDLGEDLQGDVPLAALEDVDRLLMRQSLEGLAVHANDLEVSMMVTRIKRLRRGFGLGCVIFTSKLQRLMLISVQGVSSALEHELG